MESVAADALMSSWKLRRYEPIVKREDVLAGLEGWLQSRLHELSFENFCSCELEP